MKKIYSAPAVNCVEMEDDLMDVWAVSGGIRGINKKEDVALEEEVENDDETSGIFTPGYMGWDEGDGPDE